MDKIRTSTEKAANSPEQDALFLNPTPMFDELENGPWPSFITGLKELAERTRKPMLREVVPSILAT